LPASASRRSSHRTASRSPSSGAARAARSAKNPEESSFESCGFSLGQPSVGELPDRLQHPVPRAVHRRQQAHEALADEGRDIVEVRLGDLFHSSQARTADEDGQAAKRLLLAFVEQVVAPADRGIERSLAVVGVARPAEQVPPAGEPLQQHLRWKRRGSRRCELDRQRQVVETPAQLRHCAGVECRRTRGRGTREEEVDRIRPFERIDRDDAFAREREWLAARRDHAQVFGRAKESADDARGLVEDVLAVVDEQQYVFRNSCGCHVDVIGVEDRDECRAYRCVVAESRERDPEHTAREDVGTLGREPEREPGLPRSAGAGEREQPVRSSFQRLDLALSSDEGCRRKRHVGAVQRLERRERLTPQLEDPDWGREVLQPMLAEIAQLERVGLEERHRRRGEQHLTAVRGAGDACRAVNVETDVAVVDRDRLAGVQAHPDADRRGGERFLNVLCARHSLARRGEDAEEGVALRVDLDAAVRRDCCADQPVVLLERLGVGLGAELRQGAGRPLDIGEEEGERARRQPFSHRPNVRRQLARVEIPQHREHAPVVGVRWSEA
jgi:hypothetical protein